MGCVLGEKELIGERARAAARGLRFVFTNGCFDLLHAGHLDVLSAAKRAGDLLAVGLNSDASVRRLKGEGRPLIGEGERAELLAALGMVDYVVLFHEDTPARLIEALAPDVLVKGGDYSSGEIVGSDFVRARGGRVLVVPLRPGASTRGLIDKIVERYGRGG